VSLGDERLLKHVTFEGARYVLTLKRLAWRPLGFLRKQESQIVLYLHETWAKKFLQHV